MSLYPLTDDYLEVIERFVRSLVDGANLEVVVNQMSTQICGELEDVMSVVEAATRASFSSGGPQVLVTKFLNAELPISKAPNF